jgi:hypothetical protein
MEMVVVVLLLPQDVVDTQLLLVLLQPGIELVTLS